MAHGYARGCRCDDCREKHRKTQLAYRNNVRINRHAATVDRLSTRIIELGVDEALAKTIARTIKTEFM
jgi:hypothetical protein